MAERNTGARIYLTVIGLALALAGGVFTWLMWRSFSRARAIDEWPKVPCVVIESTVEERQIDPARPIEMRFKVLYSYEWEGEEYKSDRYRLRGSSWSSRPDGVKMLIDQYPAASVQECLVNPEQPDLAVLFGESRAPGYSLWFPVIFLVGGLGVVVGAWRR
ncbi:DUF3592 domain-containing protein [Haloferula sp.]|uniref:DUF3592 domain-containing protein n=1 Tax=Haloferula sp. TaxID=2497595 RepID=UPI00329BC060